METWKIAIGLYFLIIIVFLTKATLDPGPPGHVPNPGKQALVVYGPGMQPLMVHGPGKLPLVVYRNMIPPEIINPHTPFGHTPFQFGTTSSIIATLYSPFLDNSLEEPGFKPYEEYNRDKPICRVGCRMPLGWREVEWNR